MRFYSVNRNIVVYISNLLASSKLTCTCTDLHLSVKFCCRQMYDDDSEKVCDVLRSIGLVCFRAGSKMYTMNPSKIFYYVPNIKDYNPYRNYLISKPSNVRI